MCVSPEGPVDSVGMQLDGAAESVAVDLRTGTSRNQLIDFLRGVCLVAMTINHLPHTPLNTLSSQPTGFVSSAEGFVFLSGLVTGLVYGRTALQRGMKALRARVFARLRLIYIGNAIFLVFAFLTAKAGITTLGVNVHPTLRLWVEAMACLITPTYAEILRMYIVFFLLIPTVVWALLRNYVRYVLLISAVLCIISAMGFGMTMLPEAYGYFDLVSWQFLFVTGICFGFQSAQGKLNIRKSAILTAASIVVVSVLFLFRHGRGITGSELASYFAWLKVWRRTLGFGRLIDFTGMAYLVYRFRTQFTKIAITGTGQVFAFLGKHSLQVFVWSVCVCMLVWGINGQWATASTPRHILVQLLVVASCFIPAWLHAKWQSLSRTSPPMRRQIAVITD